MNLALLVQAGINIRLKRQKMEAFMKDFVKEISENNSTFAMYNASVPTIFKFISLWLQNDCFSNYREDICSLNTKKHVEVPIKLVDLITVWLLLAGLSIVSILGLLYERVKSKWEHICLK